MKKLLKFTLAASMAMSAIPLQAQANEAGGDVVISENGTEVTIGNGYLSRTFTTEGGQLRTKAITNSRINEVFEPASGSEDFIINLVDDTQDVEEISIRLPHRCRVRAGARSSIMRRAWPLIR